ncbi:MAG: hypothetical protein IJ622_09735 [Bacteroidales bacterium]|nr:hypothetical protein [Bacteroidales bacterium]
MTRKSTLVVFMGLSLLVLCLSSCNKFEGPQKVPAYIHVDSIVLNCDYTQYGASTSNITDAWVYVDDQILGCFELPATFPVLKSGPHKVAIYGGVKSNGIADARSYYPFYKPFIYQNLNLVEDSIVILNPVLNYYDIGEGATVAWMEDFENANTLLPDTESDTSVVRVSGNEAWHSPNSFWSGRVELPPDSLDFTIATADEFTFYQNMNGVYCLLEMDYNCNDTFFVGVQYYKDYRLTTWPLVKVLPTDKQHDKPQRWNKIYINIGPTMNNNATAGYFKIYFTSDLTTNEDLAYGYEYHPLNERRYYYFDNLKLLYRKL